MDLNRLCRITKEMQSDYVAYIYTCDENESFDNVIDNENNFFKPANEILKTGDLLYVYSSEENKLSTFKVNVSVSAVSLTETSLLVPNSTLNDDDKKALNLGTAKSIISQYINNGNKVFSVYMDNANGSDDNDGLTQQTPLKTIEGFFAKYPIVKNISINFLSDYNGNMNFSTYDINRLILQSSNTASHPKIKGQVQLPYAAAVNIIVVDIEYTFNGEPGPDGAICTNFNNLSMQLSNITVKNNTTSANKASGLRITNSIFSIISNVNVNVASGSNPCKCAFDIQTSNGAIMTNTSTGFTNVCVLSNGAELRTTSGFINNSSCTSGTAETNKILLTANQGCLYAKDGIWQRQE